MRLNFFAIRFRCFKSPLRVVTFDSCFDDADRSCKNQIDARAIVARATLKRLARNLLNISGVAAINKPCSTSLILGHPLLVTLIT